MRPSRSSTAVLVGALLVTACSSGSNHESAHGGRIATTDRGGIQLVDPTSGEIEWELLTDGSVTQPTWSRDGSQLVAMAFDETAVGRLLLVDPETGTSRLVPASRPYFFFTWSSDGTKVAALGPGTPVAGRPPLTALDILDHDGNVVSTGLLEGPSLFVAWEPGGESLLAHQDAELLLLDDPTDLTRTARIDLPGTAFQAPSWIPGTRSALMVLQRPGGERLTRVDVDTGTQIDLGPTGDFALMAVAPDGRSAALAHQIDTGGSTTIAYPVAGSDDRAQGTRPATAHDISAPVEEIDLTTGTRTPVSRVPALWIEWNPAGDALIALHADLTWSVWSDHENRSLTETRPSDVFFRNYVIFSGQYNETPRLWSPDGSAITYAADTDEGNRFFVLPVRAGAGPAIDLGRGQVAFWSPG
jgi:WD40 repeat protein